MSVSVLPCSVVLSASSALILSIPCLLFFTPLTGRDFSTKNLVKLDILEKVGNSIKDNNVKALTKQKKYFPSNAVDLIQTIQNFTIVIGKIFGSNSFIYIQNMIFSK